MSKTINLNQIDPEDAELIRQFFYDQAQAGIEIWDNYRRYQFSNGVEFFFVHQVFKRERKDKNPGFRYEVISNNEILGFGGFGEVKEIEGTLNLDKDVLSLKKFGKDGKSRVVKKQFHYEKNPLSSLWHEFEHAKHAEKLSVKKPVIIKKNKEQSTSYMVMNNLGRPLSEIINDDLAGKNVLTTTKRLQLSKNLLFALKLQVTDKGLIHRDIKPENILIDSEELSIIDFAFCISADKQDGKSKGTSIYKAIELTSDPYSLSYKSDVYSLGRILALLWHVNNKSYKVDSNLYKHSLKTRTHNLCQKIPDLEQETKAAIRETITGMLQRKPEQRLSIDEAVAKFPQENRFNFDCQNYVLESNNAFFQPESVNKQDVLSVQNENINPLVSHGF